MLGQLASCDVIPAICALRRKKLSVEKLAGLAVHFIKASASAGGVIVAVLGHSHAGTLRKEPHGFDVVEVLNSANKRDDVAPRAAAKAIIALRVRVNMERRRALRMKRTSAGICAAGAFQLDIIFNDRNYLVAVPKFLQETLR